MNRCQLQFQRAFYLGGVGVDARHTHRRAIGPCHSVQQFAQVLFELFSTAPERPDVGVAAGGAMTRHPLGEAAVVAAQGTVCFVEHAVGAAVGAFAFPVAIAALQYGGVAATVEQNHALLTPNHPVLNGLK